MSQKNEIKEFGIKRENEERRDGGCAIVFDPTTRKYAVGKHHDANKFRLFSGGVSPDEDIEKGVMREVLEESGLHDFQYIEKIAEAMTHYHNSLKNVNRVGKATCFLAILKSADLVETKLEEHEKFSLAWVDSDELLENWNSWNMNHDCDHWIYFLEKATLRLKELGYLS